MDRHENGCLTGGNLIMYLGPIAIARYSYTQKEVPTKTCNNSGCNNFHRPNLLGVYCNACGTKMDDAYRAKISVPRATPIVSSEISYYHDDRYCHYYVLSGLSFAGMKSKFGFNLYVDPPITKLPNVLDMTEYLKQMRTNNHQALIDAGYDSVEYVFGLLLPESEDD